MDRNTFTAAGKSVLTTKDQTRRKEVLVTLPKCWIADYETEINVLPTGRYYSRIADRSVSQDADQNARYRLLVPLLSNSDITVEIRLKVTAYMDVMDNFKRLPIEEAMKIKPVVEGGVDDWNGRFKMKITDPKCGSRTLAIRYVPVWVEQNEHFELRVLKTTKREKVVDNSMILALTSDAFTATHEFGHCLGLPDEYAAMPGMKSVRFIHPDGSQDVEIATPEAKSEQETDASLMSSRNNYTFFPRHAWNIAIEAQALLRKELGRKITCDIFLA